MFISLIGELDRKQWFLILCRNHLFLFAQGILHGLPSVGLDGPPVELNGKIIAHFDSPGWRALKASGKWALALVSGRGAVIPSPQIEPSTNSKATSSI